MFYKGEFFIEEPQTKFMRAIAGLLMTKAEKKYTLVKKKWTGKIFIEDPRTRLMWVAAGLSTARAEET